MLIWLSALALAGTARGVIFEDTNGNGVRDEGERGLPGLGVSNQRDVVETEADGGFRLEVGQDDTIFVVKPDGYDFVVDEDHLPRFYYTHKPKGSPAQFYPGVKPTGRLPKSVEIGLVPGKSRARHRAILWADPQPETYWELQHVVRDGVDPVLGTDAAFGVVLGDIMFDRLNLFELHNQALGRVGIPFHHVIGNHDLNQDANEDLLSDETFESLYGPSYYSFDVGRVHYVVLDNVVWTGERYRGGFGETQLGWLAKDLARVPAERPLALLMHIPLLSSTGEPIEELQGLLDVVSDREQVVAFAGHTHAAYQMELGEKDGWAGKGSMDLVVSATLSGAWWSGPKDVLGIPDAMQVDGVPNGWTWLDVDGETLVWTYQGARMPADHQMRVYDPVWDEETKTFVVEANVFYGSSTTEVAWRLDEGEWASMRPFTGADPLAEDLYGGVGSQGKPWVGAWPTSHLWKASLPGATKLGVHRIEVRMTDRWRRSWTERRVVMLRK